MKVKVLSLLIPALLAVGATNVAEIYNKGGSKSDLYGKVDGLYYFSDDESVDGGQIHMCPDLKSGTQVTDRLIDYDQWEYQVQNSSAENEGNSWARVTFAGLKFQDMGSFNYGRNYGVVYNVTSWTNVLPEFSGDTYSSGDFMQQHGNGSTTHHSTDFSDLVDGLNLAVQYRGKNSSVSGEDMINNGRDALRQNGDGVGGSITYDYEGLSIDGAISSSKRTDDQSSPLYIGNGDRAETYIGSLKCDANNTCLAAQYTQTYNAIRVGSLGWANKAQNFETIAQHQFGPGLRPSLTYLQSKDRNLGRGYDDEDILKCVDAGVTYYFNKDISTYVNYKIDLLDNSQFTCDTGINADNIVALDLVYQF